MVSPEAKAVAHQATSLPDRGMTARSTLFRRLSLIARGVTALAATGLCAPLVHAQTRPPAAPALVSPTVAWPATGGVARVGANGLDIDGGVAGVDESTQYSLSSLTTDADGVIRFTYSDTWTLEQPVPSSCDFTFRRVERALTQTAANDLAKRLSAIELQRLKDARPGLATGGLQVTTGAVVHQLTDRFTWPDGDKTAHGLTRTWIFVLTGKAYYVNKTCTSHEDAADLTVIDQLIGLDYHRDKPAA